MRIIDKQLIVYSHLRYFCLFPENVTMFLFIKHFNTCKEIKLYMRNIFLQKLEITHSIKITP